MAERCTAEHVVADPTGDMTGVRGSLLTVGPTGVRCRDDLGHEGAHHAWVNPFPGFADRKVEWHG